MSENDTERFEADAKKYAQILAKVWSDEEFAKSFKAEPQGTEGARDRDPRRAQDRRG